MDKEKDKAWADFDRPPTDLTPYKINICPEAAIGRRVSKGYFIGPRSNRIEFWDHPVSSCQFSC